LRRTSHFGLVEYSVPHLYCANVYRVGTLFSSMMFPDRAPDDQYLYTTFVGGSHNRDLAGAPTYKSYFDDLCCFLIFKLDRSNSVLIQVYSETTCDL
jgi:hypothetical protein